MTFVFNKSYNDKDQVREFLPRFTELRDEMRAMGQYPYNSCFVGKIHGIEGPDEETAIYLLQNLYDIEAEARAMSALREEMQPLTELSKTTKFAKIVVYQSNHFVGGTGTRKSFEHARVVPKNGRPYVILPKGKRTHGYLIAGYEVLVRPMTRGESEAAR